jgi:hypothetical protein
MNDKINPFLKTLQEDCEEAARPYIEVRSGMFPPK